MIRDTNAKLGAVLTMDNDRIGFVLVAQSKLGFWAAPPGHFKSKCQFRVAGLS